MPSSLIMSRDRLFREDCRTALRKAGFRVMTTEDIIDGLKELNWYYPNVIIAAVHFGNLKDIKALSILRTRHRHIPLLLIVDDEESDGSIAEMADLVLRKSVPMEEIAEKVKEMARQAANA